MLLLSGLMKLGTSKYGLLAFAGFLLMQGYLVIRPNVPRLDPARANVADRIATRVAEALGAHAGDAWAGKYVIVARLDGDYGDGIRKRVQTAIERGTNCKMLPDTTLAELHDEVLAKAARLGVVKPGTADRLKGNQASNLEEARALAKRRGADIVVYGTVQGFRVVRDEGHAKVVLNAADVGGAAPAFQQEFEEGTRAASADIDAGVMRDAVRRPAWRFTGWLLFVLLLPVCTAAFWMRLLEWESAKVNVVCVLALTSLDTLFAWAMMGFWMGTGLYWLILLLGIAMAGNYNLFILNVLERNREKSKYAS